MIDFEKSDGLVPTVVCDAFDGRPRMLAYSTRESLDVAVREGRGVYWSRSRSELWRKGETSGNSQRLVRVETDCDRDALLFYVEQTGPTCHRGTDRCFEGSTPFTWETLSSRIAERAAGSNTASYTRTLLDDPALLCAKIMEEAAEVTEAQSVSEVAWECADLLYFMTVKMQRCGVRVADVMAQLEERAR
jgi:phosphoribosyl-ATP pyrophosphohydrolase